MVLLDLIGASNPMFYNTFKETNDLFERLQLIGMSVKELCLGSGRFIYYRQSTKTVNT